MITLTDEQISAIGAKVIPRAAPEAAKSTELVDLLREMKGFSSKVTALLNRPDDTPGPVVQGPPVVHVSPAAVSVQPIVNVQQNKRWRFTVTKRDNTAQQRIQEILVETLE